MFSVLLHSGKFYHCLLLELQSTAAFSNTPTCWVECFHFQISGSKRSGIAPAGSPFNSWGIIVPTLFNTIPNNANVMETSGFAAIRCTVWTNSSSQNHTLITSNWTLTLIPLRRHSLESLDLLLQKQRSQSPKDMDFYDTEIRVKDKIKWLEITFLVRLRHRVRSVFNLGEF